MVVIVVVAGVEHEVVPVTPTRAVVEHVAVVVIDVTGPVPSEFGAHDATAPRRWVTSWAIR